MHTDKHMNGKYVAIMGVRVGNHEYNLLLQNLCHFLKLLHELNPIHLDTCYMHCDCVSISQQMFLIMFVLM